MMTFPKVSGDHVVKHSSHGALETGIPTNIWKKWTKDDAPNSLSNDILGGLIQNNPS
jgi:hypothetical protein